MTVRHLGFDGQAHDGRVVVAATMVPRVRRIFYDLYRQRYPIRRIRPMSQYRGDDDRSMAWDNTSGFNCRAVTGGTSWSRHAYGTAIDLNPRENPYVRGSIVLPPNAGPYVDRTRRRPGMLLVGDPAVRAFTTRGLAWGGTWTDPVDWQHFQR